MIKDRIKSLRRVKASKIRANPKNWRQHPKQQRKAIEAVLSSVGYVDALIATENDDGTLTLLDGHLRQDVSGDEKVPVLVVDLDENEADAILASFDPIGEMARTDESRIEELVRSIEAEDEDMKYLLDRVLRDKVGKSLFDENVESTPVVIPSGDVDVERGDLFLLGSHRLLCGDSTNADDVARLLDGEKPALMATDPPYCVEYTGADRPHDSGKDWSDKYREVDIKDLGEFLRDVFKAVLPALKDDAGIYIWHAHLQYPVIHAVFEEFGLLPHQPIVWTKPSSTFTYSFYRWQHEPCLFGWKKGNKPPHYMKNTLSTVWEIDWEGKARIVGNDHPTQKPLRLFEIPMEQHTRRGEIVFEPFSGSGSQLLAAERLGRRCRAMEISPAFVRAAVSRWEAFTGQEAERIRASDQ